MPSNQTALIIGAGPAGLTAARQLLKHTAIHPIILEETDKIGGISRTEEHHGNRMDIGGHRFFSKSREVNALWESLLPPGDPAQAERVMLLRPRVSRIFYLRKFFDYPISLSLQTFKNMGLSRTMKAGFGYLGSMLHKREENTLEDFYINRFGKPLYEMFFEDYTEKLWGVPVRDIAPDWGAQRVKGLSLTKAVAEVLRKAFRPGYKTRETSLIEQFHYPKRGPGQLWEALADEIRALGGEIRLGSKVTGVALEGNRATGVRINDQESLPGDYVISAMPVKDLVAAMGEAPPAPVRDIAAALPYRDFITVGLLLDKLKLGQIPDTWIYIQERDVRIGRLQVFNNWSPYMAADPAKLWIGLEYFCGEGDAMWNMPPEEFIQFAIDELVKIDIIEAKDVLDATHIRVKKAYPAYFGAYKDFDIVRNYLDGIENLYCVGRNGQHRYNNMDHSMLTAIAAVEAMRNGAGDKSPIWDVNTEEEYHEEK
ncbi:MAG: NAD(P)/FAD-dependent oxidoreductase [Firmicutes bacterium]|nr:NAD(P)/FAD-dependent oxidoreductase [Bacillota bacterium]